MNAIMTTLYHFLQFSIVGGCVLLCLIIFLSIAIDYSGSDFRRGGHQKR